MNCPVTGGEGGFTCPSAPIGQVRRDGDCPALTHAHPPQALLDAGEEATLTQQAHLGVSSLVAV